MDNYFNKNIIQLNKHNYQNTFASKNLIHNANNYANNYGIYIPSGRDIIDTLIDVLHIFTIVITEDNGFTPTLEFIEFIDYHLDWLASIDDDTRLFDFTNKYNLTQVKALLTYPHTPLQGCYKYCDQIMDIAIIFRRAHEQLGTRCINTLPSNQFHSLATQFAAINSRLAYIFRSMPPADYDTMKENNRQLYYQLNKYVLHPVRIQHMADNFNIDFFDYLDTIF
jgi:hypothetical protein